MKFTIVMTAYKREELFLHALYTVIQQDYPDWELIVIADGPHPNIERAVDLVKEDQYQAFWDRPSIPSRISYHELAKSPAGTVGNPGRRAGLELATGDYICFVGHDCLIDKNYLSTHKSLIDKKGAPCVSVVSVSVGFVAVRLPVLAGSLFNSTNRHSCSGWVSLVCEG